MNGVSWKKTEGVWTFTFDENNNIYSTTSDEIADQIIQKIYSLKRRWNKTMSNFEEEVKGMV